MLLLLLFVVYRGGAATVVAAVAVAAVAVSATRIGRYQVFITKDLQRRAAKHACASAAPRLCNVRCAPSELSA